MNCPIKYCLSLFLPLILFASSNAQILRALKGVDEVEVIGGPSLVSLFSKNINNDTRQPKIGYVTRVGFVYDISKKFSISTSFSYEGKGLKTKYKVLYYDPTIDSTNCQCTVSSGETKNNSSIDYFSILTTVRFKPTNLNIYVEGGFFGGYMLKARVRSRNLWDNTIYNTNGIDNYRRTDLGVSVSLGYNIVIGRNTRLSFKLIDNYGLLNISNSSTPLTTNSFSLLAGLNFKLN